jgi:hypothetical protein
MPGKKDHPPPPPPSGGGAGITAKRSIGSNPKDSVPPYHDMVKARQHFKWKNHRQSGDQEGLEGREYFEIEELD